LIAIVEDVQETGQFVGILLFKVNGVVGVSEFKTVGNQRTLHHNVPEKPPSTKVLQRFVAVQESAIDIDFQFVFKLTHMHETAVKSQSESIPIRVGKHAPKAGLALLVRELEVALRDENHVVCVVAWFGLRCCIDTPKRL
jgi:hypothetical protein